MANISAPIVGATPIVVPISHAVRWIIGTLIAALAVYYFVGVDQGATSLFGADTHIHEFVHDARHFLGFPCH